MRRSDRAASHITARIIRGGQQDTACIETIAHGGLKLAGIGTLSMGERIEVHVGAVCVRVEVIWTHALHCGARFLPDTRPEAVARLRAACLRQRGRRADDAPSLPAGRVPKSLAQRKKCRPFS